MCVVIVFNYLNISSNDQAVSIKLWTVKLLYAMQVHWHLCCM